MKSARRVHIGTSGWSYAHWQGAFYPQGLPAKEWLSYYARQLSSVEINASFYKLPSLDVLAQWRDSVPSGFVFAVKASRYITHLKKLNEPRRSLHTFLGRVAVLGDKLGPILFQLPPHWHVNVERLAAFLKALPEDYRYVMEFRDPTWLVPRVYELLAEHNVAFCIFDLNGALSPLEVSADFVYVRLHGPDDPYQGQYGDCALASWADAFKRWRRGGREVYCYFDNDEAAYAPRDALRLQERAGRGGKVRRARRFSG
jgi:uncharacterized protein YecE (DUF72 family)